MRISDYFFSPTLAPLMKKRREALFLGGLAATQFGLVALGLPGVTCPFKAVLGIPCPGCGISTSISFLLHGDWHSAFTTHAFGPIFLFGLAFVLGASILPETMRLAVIEKIALIEKRTGITALLMLSVMFYWGFRLLKF
jgi:hypothetical protein